MKINHAATMKKIMFNNKYGLNQAVLDGLKTMTRRPVGNRMTEDDIDAYLRGYHDVVYEHAPFKIGEVVAIAQSYHDIGMPPTECINGLYRRWCDEPGWDNKMFVKSELMPSRIKFTDLRLERLQDISDEDCLKEGVYYHTTPPKHHEYDRYSPWSPSIRPYKFESEKYFCSARYAFKYLIEKVSGKGIWESNPWNFAYSFERVK